MKGNTIWESGQVCSRGLMKLLSREICTDHFRGLGINPFKYLLLGHRSSISFSSCLSYRQNLPLVETALTIACSDALILPLLFLAFLPSKISVVSMYSHLELSLGSKAPQLAFCHLHLGRHVQLRKPVLGPCQWRTRIVAAQGGTTDSYSRNTRTARLRKLLKEPGILQARLAVLAASMVSCTFPSQKSDVDITQTTCAYTAGPLLP